MGRNDPAGPAAGTYFIGDVPFARGEKTYESSGHRCSAAGADDKNHAPARFSRLK